MTKPFILINSELTKRKEFRITSGVQPTYAFLYIKSGSFALKMHGQKTVISKGDAVIFSDSEHFYRSVNKEIEFIFVKFKFNPDCSFLPMLPTGKITFKDNKRFLSTMNTYEKLLLDNSKESAYLKQHLLEDVLLQISNENKHLSIKENAVNNDNILSLAIAFLDQNLNKKIAVEDLCKASATNPSTLNFRFRRAFNLSTGEFIINHKLSNAKKMLVTTTYTVSEIAFRLGFDNQFYFSTLFKKREGLSPLAYRQKHGI